MSAWASVLCVNHTGIEGGQQCGCDGHGGVHQAAHQREYCGQSEGSDQAGRQSRDHGSEAGDLPPGSQIDCGQWGMSVGQGRIRDQRAGTEEIECSGNVVARLIPEIGQPHQRQMGEQNERVDDRKNNPGGNGFVAMSAKKELLQQRMRRCDGGWIQRRIRGRQIIAPDKSKGITGGPSNC